MRLLGKIKSNNVNILNMASGMGEPITPIEKDTVVTLTSYKKEGDNGYYYCIEHNGWIPSHSIQVTRDIEFFYTSSMKHMMKANTIAARSVSVLADSNNNSSEFKESTTENSGSKSIWSTNKYGKLATAVGANIIGNNAVTNIANSFIQDGDWKKTMNESPLNSFFNDGSGGWVSSLLEGATIGNISDGTFFKKGLLEPEGLLNNIYKLLLNKLEYVVGHSFSSNWNWLLNMLGDIYFGSSPGISSDIRFPQIPYLPPTAQLEKYFRYKGCDYKMITRTFGYLQRWTQDASYAIPSFSSKQVPSEVAFHREIYNANYSEYRDAIDYTKKNLNLTMDRQDWFVNFNRYRLCHPDSVLNNSFSYVFFTRPDLNLNTQGSGISISALGPFLYNIMSQHPVLAKSLTKSYTGIHYFLPYLSNKVKAFDIQDEQIKTRDVGETLTGFKIPYGFHNIESITANTLNITFDDDEMLSTYLIFKIWTEYISGVSRGIITPNIQYARRKILDYAVSIYYFLCAPDGESILYWTKYTGAFPTNVPSSNFSLSDGDRVKKPVHNITWIYAEKRDYNPLHLAEFNGLSNSDYTYIKPYSPDLFRSTPTLQGAPFVDTNTGGKLFKLRFRQAIKD